MTTATPPQNTESMVREIEHDYLEESEIADALLFEIAAENRRPTSAEFAYFSRHLGWNEFQAKDQLRRVAQARNLMAIAGSPQDREAAAKEAETASAVLSKEGPRIADQIEKLQSKLNGLERDARLSSKRVDEQNEAVAKLRALAPEHATKPVGKRLAALHEAEGRAVQDVEARVAQLASCLNPDNFRSHGSRTAYEQHVLQFHPDAVGTRVDRQYVTYYFTAQWPGIKSAIEAELVELRDRLAVMQAEYADKKSQIELGLNHYAQGVAQ